jgi:hypothetical protein
MSDFLVCRTVLRSGKHPFSRHFIRSAPNGSRPRASQRRFSWGGLGVTRLEGASILTAIARHVAWIELAGEPEMTANMAVHGHESLPLRLVPA